MILLSERRKGGTPFVAAPAEPAPQRAEAMPREDYFEIPFLLERLDAASDQVKMWSAFQLVDRHQDQCGRFIERLWNSPRVEIRESAIGLIGKYRIHAYAFPLLRVAVSNEGGLRPAAALALGRLGYEPAARPLAEWFAQALAQTETNTREVEAAAEALLLLDNQRFWEELFVRLEASHQNHSIYAILFRQLCQNAEHPGQIERLAQAYRAPREIFHDHHLTRRFVETLGRPNMSRFLQTRLSSGYTLSAVYHECLTTLGTPVGDVEMRALLHELGRCTNTRSGMERFLELSPTLIQRLVPPDRFSAAVLGFLRGSASWVRSWEEAILKVREEEHHLLVSLPLVALLNHVEGLCLAAPEAEAGRISRIYQSPLLSPPFMARILGLLAQQGEAPGRSDLVGAPLGSWLRDEEKDTLWKLYTRQLDGVDYPFEQVLPQPWEYPVPGLMGRLLAALRERLDEYVSAGRAQAIDYALEVFRRQGGAEDVAALLRHFPALINGHFPAFVELMTHLPDARFLPPLLEHYRPGEYELEQLIRFVCDVHRLPYPEAIRGEPAEPAGGPLAMALRLHCPACGGAYQYALRTLYVNEERIEQRQVPAARDLWTPEPFPCKRCGATVPLQPEPQFLTELYAELLAARLHRVGDGESALLDRIRLIAFPAIEGRTLNPAEFLERAETDLARLNDPAGRVPYLLEQGRFYLDIGEVDAARQALHKVLAGPVPSPMAIYYLGIIAFQEKNLYEARVHFSRLIATCSRDEFDKALDNPVDMAHHYLKLLDKREFKRSHFHLVSS